MKLLYLTAGAAEMYCGSCLRDNALAAALMKRGHDVVLMPIYTPTHTDEKNVSSARVFFGGISVFLQQHVPLFRHTPAVLDRLWDSTPVLKLASKRQIKIDPASLGSMTVSMLKGRDGFQRKEIEKMLRWIETESRFDVINLPFTLLLGLAKPLKDTLGVPVVCTIQGDDLFLQNLQEPWRSESLALIQRAAEDVEVFLSVSDYYVAPMSKYLGIPKAKIRTVPIGINFDGFDPRPRRATPPYTVGFFARIAPEKGLHVLADAYRRLRQRPGVPYTRLVAGGYLLDEHRGYLQSIEKEMAAAGLAADFSYAGAPDRAGKIDLLRSFDVFSVPAVYEEPKGLFLLEALATGLPVVQPRRGAFPEILAKTGGGVVVPADDPEALADALFALLTDPARRAALGREGAAGVRAHYGVEPMAKAAEAVYREVARP